VTRALAAAPVRLQAGPKMLVFEADEQLGIASTAVLGGGMLRGRCIVSLRVPAGYAGRDPAGDILRAARAAGWEPDVGLMTAADLGRARTAAAHADGVTAVATVTAGVARPWAAGSSRGPHPAAGTINTVVVVNAALTPAAALNLLTTVTEAKVLGLLEAGVSTADGEPASGTATDAVVVAWPLGGEPLPFGGPATAPGWAAAAAIRQALRESLHA
jgi:adenosylcobinamide hydrolase